MDDRFAPPAHLSERAKTLWLDLVPSKCRSRGRLTLLCEALSALDRATQAREELAGSKLTTVTESTKAVHLNPLLKAEREARAQFARMWSDLGLGSDWVDRIDFERWQQQQEAQA
jgi:phage terminase small subunit